MDNSIKISHINKKYGNKEILKDISFEAHAGRITAFLGPNGAGKSTTLRILLGLDKADSGTALIGGKGYAQLQRPLTRTGASFDGVGSPNDCVSASAHNIRQQRHQKKQDKGSHGNNGHIPQSIFKSR